LELCSVPRGVLASAVHAKNSALLTTIKGIGKKSAEKLLVELSSLAERAPEIFTIEGDHPLSAKFDQDTVAALTQLGFSTQDVLKVLETLPPDLKTTEERVGAALRSL
jgi:Holliday junction resolvasome RuvABC DNA-binding subunit